MSKRSDATSPSSPSPGRRSMQRRTGDWRRSRTRDRSSGPRSVMCPPIASPSSPTDRGTRTQSPVAATSMSSTSTTSIPTGGTATRPLTAADGAAASSSSERSFPTSRRGRGEPIATAPSTNRRCRRRSAPTIRRPSRDRARSRRRCSPTGAILSPAPRRPRASRSPRSTASISSSAPRSIRTGRTRRPPRVRESTGWPCASRRTSFTGLTRRDIYGCADAGAFGLHYATFVRRNSTTNEVIDGDDFYVVGTARKSSETFEYRAIRLRIAPGAGRP